MPLNFVWRASLNLPESAFEWRRRREILPLERFDFPRAHIRADFDREMILDLTVHRTAGSSVQMTPEEVRDGIRTSKLDEQQRHYLAEVFEQCDGLDIRLFRHCCGASLYELARTMIACNVRHPFVTEWLNCRAPGYVPSEVETKMYRLSSNLGR